MRTILTQDEETRLNAAIQVVTAELLSQSPDHRDEVKLPREVIVAVVSCLERFRRREVVRGHMRLVKGRRHDAVSLPVPSAVE